MRSSIGISLRPHRHFGISHGRPIGSSHCTTTRRVSGSATRSADSRNGCEFSATGTASKSAERSWQRCANGFVCCSRLRVLGARKVAPAGETSGEARAASSGFAASATSRPKAPPGSDPSSTLAWGSVLVTLATEASQIRGNTGGTPAQARASTPGHSSLADCSEFRAFFGRRDPRLPALPVSLLDGKEGVDGSSPSEGSAKAPQKGVSSFGCTSTISSVRWAWSPLWSLQVEKAGFREAGHDPDARSCSPTRSHSHQRRATPVPAQERCRKVAARCRRLGCRGDLHPRGPERRAGRLPAPALRVIGPDHLASGLSAG
jgi:hypothetical protein